MNVSSPLTKGELDAFQHVAERSDRAPISKTESLLVVLGFLSSAGQSVTINRAGRLRLEAELSTRNDYGRAAEPAAAGQSA